MCLAINIPAKTELKWDLLRAAYDNNGDGFGLMYFTANDTIHIKKIVPSSWQDVENVIKQYEFVLKTTNLALHFRWRTHGDIDENNSHPYMVLNTAEHGRDVYLVHNGTITNAPSFDNKMSDTWHFIEYMLRPMLAAKPELLDTSEGRQALSKLMDTFSNGDRFILMDSKTGETMLVNGLHKNSEWPEVWLSNTYSLRRFSKSASTSNYAHGYAYYSGYQSTTKKPAKAPVSVAGGKSPSKATVVVENGQRAYKGASSAATAPLTPEEVAAMEPDQIFMAMAEDPELWLDFLYQLVEDHFQNEEFNEASEAA